MYKMHDMLLLYQEEFLREYYVYYLSLKKESVKLMRVIPRGERHKDHTHTDPSSLPTCSAPDLILLSVHR